MIIEIVVKADDGTVLHTNVCGPAALLKVLDDLYKCGPQRPYRVPPEWAQAWGSGILDARDELKAYLESLANESSHPVRAK